MPKITDIHEEYLKLFGNVSLKKNPFLKVSHEKKCLNIMHYYNCTINMFVDCIKKAGSLMLWGCFVASVKIDGILVLSTFLPNLVL